MPKGVLPWIFYALTTRIANARATFRWMQKQVAARTQPSG